MNSKAEYEHILSIVYHQTTPAQPPMAEQTTVTQIAGYAGIEPEKARAKLRRAVERGDLIESNGRYVTTDDERVQRAISHVVEHVPVDQTLLGKLNTARMRLD